VKCRPTIEELENVCDYAESGYRHIPKHKYLNTIVYETLSALRRQYCKGDMVDSLYAVLN